MSKRVLSILIIICMSTIFFFSHQKADDSRETSSKVVIKIVEILDVKDSLTKTETLSLADRLHRGARKLAHFCIYAVLGLLFALLFKEYNYRFRHIFIRAVVFSFLYACTDEFHQLFISGRSCELRDVAIDSLGAASGALFALLLIILFARKGQRKNEVYE